MKNRAKKATAVDPRQLQAVLQRAIALHQSGRLAEADRGYSQVLKAIPNQPDALNLSGLIAHQQGKSARAVLLLKKAVTARPGFADAFNHLGLAQRKLGQTQDALASFSKAVEADQNHVEAHNNLGNARKDLGDLAGAAEAYGQACALAPSAVEPRYNLGNVLRDGEDHDGAMAAFKAVLEHAPGHVEARYNLAALFERSHQLDLAEAELDKVLAAQKDWSPALILKAKVLRRSKRLDEAEAQIEKLTGVQLGSEDATNLAVEKGKLLDITDRADAAFAAFSEANRLQLETGGSKVLRQAEYFRALVAKAIAWLEALEEWPVSAGNAGEGLVFLVGFPRSGTTLLDQVLDAHPGIVVMEERPAVDRMLNEAASWGLHLPEELLSLDDVSAAKLISTYFATVDEHVDRHDGQIIVDKMPLNIAHVLPLAKLFPRAKFILALRHPLDAILSNYMQHFRLNRAMSNFLDLDTAAETYDLTFNLWMLAAEKLRLEVHQVRYEMLIADIELEARNALNFLGVDWADEVLDPASHAKTRKTINTPSYEQVTQPIYQRANGRWRRYEAHLEPIRAKIDPWIERLGYTGQR